MRLKNRLWNPEHDTIERKKEKKKPPQDEICAYCPNKDQCLGLCPPLQWINGRSETKELIPSKPIESTQVEYNDKLYEYITNKETTDLERLELIRSLSDYRIRIISASVMVGVPQEQIGKIAHISQGRISRLYRGLRR